MKKLGLVAALAALGVLASTGIGTGSGSDEKKPLDTAAGTLPVHQVEKPSGRTATVARARSVRNVRTAYYETSVFPVAANGREAFITQCPKGRKVVSGYFNTDGGIVLDGMAVQSTRSMFFSLIDLTGSPGQAYAGLVCQRVIR